ncbi:unnamed protein product [Diamesa hyperborea]
MNSANQNAKVFEIIYENEKVADQVLVKKHEIVEWDKKRQGNREAIRELRKSEDENVWITVGSMLVQMERIKAIEVITKEQIEIDAEITKLRSEQHTLVNKHRDLEHTNRAKGFDLKPMNTNEMNTIKNSFKMKI